MISPPKIRDGQDFLSGLQRTTPRAGLNAKTASFIDHLVAIAGRYGPHLFHCFDDPELPATTNQLEGFFGKTKQQARRALGCGSTTHSLVHNLGDEFLLAYQQVTAGSLDVLAEPIDPQAYRQARDKLKEQEQPARQRRSFVRRLSFHLNEILTRWRALISLLCLATPGGLPRGDAREVARRAGRRLRPAPLSQPGRG